MRSGGNASHEAYRYHAVHPILPPGDFLGRANPDRRTCSSSTLSGAYAFSLTGRQVSAAGSFSGVLQGVGTATFDGLNAVKIALTVDTAQTAATALNWSGTYSMQSNCAGVITITSGGTATLNLVLFGQGVNFLVSGNDGTYSYSGTGNNQPTACTASLLSGAYCSAAPATTRPPRRQRRLSCHRTLAVRRTRQRDREHHPSLERHGVHSVEPHRNVFTVVQLPGLSHVFERQARLRVEPQHLQRQHFRRYGSAGDVCASSKTGRERASDRHDGRRV